MEQIKETSLKFSESPLCPIAADVISDGESIYFYMYDIDEYKGELRGFYLDIYKELPGKIYEYEKQMLLDIKNNVYDYSYLKIFNERFNSEQTGNCAQKVIDIVFKDI